MNKRLLKILICLLCVLSCLIPSMGLAEGGEKEILTVGVPTDRCPMFCIDADTDEIVGIGVDLMRISAENAGYDTRFVAIKEDTLKEALDNSDYDIVMPFGSAIKSAQGQVSVISDNLLQTPFTLVTQGKKQLPPLNSLIVGMLSSLSGAGDTIRELYPGIEIIMCETMDECVDMLLKGKVDALLYNSYVWSYLLQKPSYSNLVVQPTTMFSMDFAAGTLDTPEGRELIEKLNKGIAMLEDTQRQAVILDYTSRRLYRYNLSDYIYEDGIIILLAVLLIFALIIIAVQKVQKIRKEQEEKMRIMLDHDPLTGVLNLTGFRRRAEELLREHPDVPYMLAYTNIRNFKYINDSMGKEAGDELLRFWAKRTSETLSELEAVARLESDHLAVLRHMGGEERLAFDDGQVVDSVRSYFTDRGSKTRVQVCGGVYVLTQKDYQHADVDHMLDLARVAEQRVRETRMDGYEFYNPDQWEKGKMAADIVGHLTAALKSGDIQVWYQPQVNYSEKKIIGAEALCRWNHVTRGWISPAEFIPKLEEAGLIYELDRFVWDRVCQDLQRWNSMGIRRSVSVNLSRFDILECKDIPGHFEKLIKTYGLDAKQLGIEITETAYVENPELLVETTNGLKNLGFRVEMDDFGSGYSSLHMLKELPVDRVKLDLYFLTETGDTGRGRTIVSSIVQMGHALGMELIAEGVETEKQAEFLKSVGCKEMQGFYFFKPMPVSDFDRLILT